jgi:kynurenine formamidase
MAFVDLSHHLEDGMAAYPGLPPARIEALIDHDASRERYEEKAEFYLGTVTIAGNTGTYLDAPFHRFRDREDLAALPLEAVVGLRGLVVDADPSDGRAVTLEVSDDELAGRAVLVRTGWDERWGSDDYWRDAPFLPAKAVDRLVAARAALVGVDFGNVDDTGDLSRPGHTGLLGAGIPIVENLRRLDRLPREGFTFSAPPLAIVRGAAFPVRAFAEVP